MTTHWVSQEKHFCKYCKCWCSGNKNSIARHEKGVRHNENVRVWYLRKREQRYQKEKDTRENDKAMREIEKAAQAAFSQDLAAIAGGKFGASTQRGVFVPQSQLQSHLAQQTATPPKAPTCSAAPKYSRTEFEKGQQEEPLLERKVDLKDDPFAGQYIVKGQVYIETRYHEDKLVRGVRCEAWSEADEEWKPCAIESVYKFAVPNTDLCIRQYTVKYPDEVFEYARADKIRMVVPPPPEDAPTQVQDEAPTETATDDPADETAELQRSATGYGTWTVMANPTAPLPPPPAPPMKALVPAGADVDDSSTDAFKAFNPYGGAYKGVDVEDEHAATLGQLNDLGTTEQINFKKRKGSGKKRKKKKRTKRQRDVDDK